MLALQKEMVLLKDTVRMYCSTVRPSSPPRRESDREKERVEQELLNEVRE